MVLSLSACGTESLTEEQIRAVIQDELSKSKDNSENDNNSTFGTPEDDYTKYFNFVLVDGKYCALSVKQNIEIPEILVVPNQYKGVEVAYTGAELISGLPIKTIIFESGVECSYWLCGSGNNCPALERIILLSENPKDCILDKLAYVGGSPKALQLNEKQINGACKIFVPDNSVGKYKETWDFFQPEYKKLLTPLSELDEETAKYIN